MSLRRRLIFTMSLVLIIMIAVVILASRWILLDSFSRLETREMDERTHAAEAAVMDDIHQVAAIAGDWAPWDETYTFLAGQNSDYIESNLMDESVSNLKVNILAYITPEKKIFYLHAFDLEKGQTIPAPESVKQALVASEPLFGFSPKIDPVSGILMLPEGPMAVASAPILTSKFEGPVQGVLVVGRYLNQVEVGRLADILHFPLSLQPVNAGTLPADYQAATLALSGSSQSYVHRLNADTVAGYARFDDIFGQPAFILRVDSPREIYQQGLVSLNFLAIALLLIALAAGATGAILLEKKVISRVLKLSDEVQHVGSSGDLRLRVTREGQDEVAILAQEINRTISALEGSEDQLKIVQEKLRHDAMHDPLTGLPNRTYFMDQLKRSLERTRRHPDLRAAVIFMDLDRFKLVNDSLGHPMGDELLVGLSRRLEDCLRAGDVVARFGGDEFAVLVEDMTSAADISKVAERIQRELSLPFVLAGQDVFVTLSSGISMLTNASESAEELLRDADTAMYKAKSQRRGGFLIYEKGMHAQNVAVFQMEAELRRAIEREEFVVWYQPIYSSMERRITAVEALVRWNHPHRGLVMPGQFIGLAEETGMILPIGEWVLRTACHQMHTWDQAGMPGIQLAVNISARQLHDPRVVNMVADALQEAGLSASRLRLEITESESMKDVEVTAQILRELNGLGVSISIDDFGTSYSSMGYLKKFPVDCIKVDRSFIKDIPENSDGAALTAAMIHMGHTLNLRVVAEGIETPAQMNFLVQKCDEMQGYLFSHPLPAKEVEAILFAPQR